MQVVTNVVQSLRAFPKDIRERRDASQRNNDPTIMHRTKAVVLKALGSALFVASLPLVALAVSTGSFAALTFGAVLLVASHDSLLVGHNMLHPGWTEGTNVAKTIWRSWWKPSQNDAQEEARYWKVFAQGTILANPILEAFV